MLCPLVRWQLSGALDRAGQRPRLAAAHVARCAGCQRFAADLEALHGRLAAGARSAPAPRPALPRRGRRGARGRLALALAGAATLVVIAWPDGDRGREAPVAGDRASPPDRPARAPDMAGRAGAMASLDAGPHAPTTRDVVGQLGVLFSAPPPLRAELEALASDGRRGALAILDLGGVRHLARRAP
jgi:hypothetical protein